MLSAAEAFEKSKEKLEETQIIDELLVVDARIKDAIEKGVMAIWSDAMSIDKAEKLCMELEEFGYFAATNNTNICDQEKRPLYAVWVGWRYRARSDSRVVQPESV